MHIIFDRTTEDLINFNLFHINHSPTIRRQLLYGRIAATTLTVFLSYLMIYLADRDKVIEPIGYVILAIGGAFIFFLYPWLTQRATTGRLKKLLSERSNASILGQQSMEISPEHLLCNSNVSTSTLKWNSITDVKENERYIFLYVSSASALVIPKQAFTDTDHQKKFLEQVNAYRIQQGGNLG